MPLQLIWYYYLKMQNVLCWRKTFLGWSCGMTWEAACCVNWTYICMVMRWCAIITLCFLSAVVTCQTYASCLIVSPLVLNLGNVIVGLKLRTNVEHDLISANGIFTRDKYGAVWGVKESKNRKYWLLPARHPHISKMFTCDRACWINRTD